MRMAVQTDYNFGFSKGVAGGLFDMSHHEVATRQAQGSVKFGLGVVKGTNAGIDVKVPDSAATANDFEGIVVHNSVMAELDMDNNLNIGSKRTVGCLVEGKIWVPVAPDANPTYKGTAYLVKDGEFAGCFTSQSAAYSLYEKTVSGTEGAKEVVADTTTPTDTQIKLSAVTPAVSNYTPAVGDYVVSRQIYGAGLDVGAKFGKSVDSNTGIAVIELK